MAVPFRPSGSCVVFSSSALTPTGRHNVSSSRRACLRVAVPGQGAELNGGWFDDGGMPIKRRQGSCQTCWLASEPMALAIQEREQFLAEPHIGALSVVERPGRAPLTVP